MINFRRLLPLKSKHNNHPIIPTDVLHAVFCKNIHLTRISLTRRHDALDSPSPTPKILGTLQNPSTTKRVSALVTPFSKSQHLKIPDTFQNPDTTKLYVLAHLMRYLLEFVYIMEMAAQGRHDVRTRRLLRHVLGSTRSTNVIAHLMRGLLKPSNTKKSKLNLWVLALTFPALALEDGGSRPP